MKTTIKAEKKVSPEIYRALLETHGMVFSRFDHLNFLICECKYDKGQIEIHLTVSTDEPVINTEIISKFWFELGKAVNQFINDELN
jgi:hypothetical protein